MNGKLTGLLTIALILIFSVSVPTFADEDEKVTSVIGFDDPSVQVDDQGHLIENGVYYDIRQDDEYGEYAVVAGCESNQKILQVSDSIFHEGKFYKVLKIDEEAFSESEIVAILMPDSIVEICDMAFINCVKLESIAIPLNCGKIGTAAFMGCSGLKSVSFGNSYCHVIGDAAFAMSGVQNVVFSDYVDSIGMSCFAECPELASVKFGANFDYVGEGAFVGCPKLEKISKSKNNKFVVIKDGCIYSKNGKTLYSGAMAKGDLIIKPGVERILPHSFEGNKNITSVTIPATVAEIPEGCFMDCKNLKSVIVSDGVEVIGENSFYNCSKLAKISIPASVNEVVENPFLYCGKLKKISVNSGNKSYKAKNNMLVKKSNNYIIAAPGVSGEISLYSGCKGIGEMAFAFNTKITKVNMNSKLRKIEAAAFYGCKSLKYVYTPNRKIDMSVSEITEDGLFCGIFGLCSENLEVNVPFSYEAGASNSIENNVARHSGNKAIVTQH